MSRSALISRSIVFSSTGATTFTRDVVPSSVSRAPRPQNKTNHHRPTVATLTGPACGESGSLFERRHVIRLSFLALVLKASTSPDARPAYSMPGESTSYARLTTGDSVPLQNMDVSSKRDALRKFTPFPLLTANVDVPPRLSATMGCSCCSTLWSVPLRAYRRNAPASSPATTNLP